MLGPKLLSGRIPTGKFQTETVPDYDVGFGSGSYFELAMAKDD
jgi:hypothetical protein